MATHRETNLNEIALLLKIGLTAQVGGPLATLDADRT